MGCKPEHGKSINEIKDYIQKHRLNELFNVSDPIKLNCYVYQELLTNFLHKKPEDPKAAVLEYLQGIKKVDASKNDPHNLNIYEMQEQFLQEEDFEAIFESMDVLETGAIPKSYLEHALSVVGVKDVSTVLAQRYSKIIDEEETVNKVSFVFILSSEHKRLGYNN